MGAGTKLEMDQFCIVTLLDTGLYKTAVLAFPVNRTKGWSVGSHKNNAILVPRKRRNFETDGRPNEE